MSKSAFPNLYVPFRANGVQPLFLTDWHSAAPDMKDLEADQ